MKSQVQWLALFVGGLPAGEVFVVAVSSGEVKPEVIICCFLKEILNGAESVWFVELIFGEPVGGFDISLVGISTRGDDLVSESLKGVDGFGEDVSLLPAGNRLIRFCVGWPGISFEVQSGRVEVIGQQLRESGGMTQFPSFDLAVRLRSRTVDLSLFFKSYPHWNSLGSLESNFQLFPDRSVNGSRNLSPSPAPKTLDLSSARIFIPLSKRAYQF